MKHEVKKKGSVGDIDVFIGQKLFALRRLRGMSQEVLSQKMGITFQQIQKYENGQNCISAARLYDASKILGSGVDYFYHGYESKTTSDLSWC